MSPKVFLAASSFDTFVEAFHLFISSVADGNELFLVAFILRHTNPMLRVESRIPSWPALVIHCF